MNICVYIYKKYKKCIYGYKLIYIYMAGPASKIDQSKVPVACVARCESSAARMRAGTTLQASSDVDRSVSINTCIETYMGFDI